MVEFDNDSDMDVATAAEVLKKGGKAILNVPLCRKLDADFDSKYAVANKEGNFFSVPAVLNFVAGNGWKLNSVTLNTYLYQKGISHGTVLTCIRIQMLAAS